LLERRIEHEVGRHDLSGPEGRARALHAAAEQVRRVNDDIARREYSRHVARLVGVDLDSVEAAVEGGRARARTGARVSNQPLDRMEAELLRVLLSDPSQVSGLAPEDFSDDRLRAAYLAVADGLSTVTAGQPVDFSGVADEGVQSLLRSLAMDERPLPSGPEMLSRVKERRLDIEIADLQRLLAGMEPGTESHSDNLRRLIALQQEKRSSAKM
jgi:DNA primase